MKHEPVKFLMENLGLTIPHSIDILQQNLEFLQHNIDIFSFSLQIQNPDLFEIRGL